MATSEFGEFCKERFNVPEVTEAEEVFKAALQEITDPELRNKIDMAAGKISYAYEILGFCAGHFSQDSRSRAAFFWLISDNLRTMTNESISYLRRSAREMPCEQEILNGAVQDRQTGQNTQFDDPQMIVTQKPEALYTAILSLPETMQTVIKLYYFEELTMPEIAAVTGMNLSTVKYRLYEGLRKLKLTMKEGVA